MRAIVPAGAAAPDPLVPGPSPREAGLSDAEARLRETVAEVTRLDAEIEALSEALAEFSRRWERATGDAFAELTAAERLAGRLQRLEDGLEQLAAQLRAGDLPRRPRRRRRRPFPGGDARRDAPQGFGYDRDDEAGASGASPRPDDEGA